MAALGLSNLSIYDPDTGLNETVFDIDPDTYDPFNAPNRGSSFETVDGGRINQVFGVFETDMEINVAGQITQETFRALWTKYINRGKVWRVEDWMGNVFNVIFKPGAQSFKATPNQGSCEWMTYSMTLQVCSVVQWFGAAYG